MGTPLPPACASTMQSRGRSKQWSGHHNLKMRLGILSDIHGNPIALEAVLGDIETQGGVGGYLVLGDLVAQGFDPAAVLRRLAELPGAIFVRGNTDRYTVAGTRAWPTIEQAQIDATLVSPLATIAQGFAWTHGYLSATGWVDWLAALQLEQRLTLPDGTRLLAVHASPGRDDGPGLGPDSRERDVRDLFRGCRADLVCVGHTHHPIERRVAGVHIVNAGSVSNPPRDGTDWRASYAMLEANDEGYTIRLHRVSYDRGAVVRAIREHHVFPNPDWLSGFYRSNGALTSD